MLLQPHVQIGVMLVCGLLLFVGARIPSEFDPNKPSKAVEVQLRIDLNSADINELAMLPRIGPATAQRIVEDRQANGPFSTISDLARVPGIGARTLQRLQPYIGVK